MAIVWTTLLVVMLVACVAACCGLTVVGLPGNWIMLAVAVVYDLLIPDGRLGIGLGFLGVLALLALFGELIEFLAGALGVRQMGGSGCSAVLAMLGSLIGGFLGVFAGAAIPIPIVGSVIGALVLASLGALAGAVAGEKWHGRELNASLKVGAGAFVGRFLGTAAKAFAGGTMAACVAAALVIA